MAKKKAGAEPAAASEANQPQSNGKERSKISLAVDLINEWEATGGDVRSNLALLGELMQRHPDRTWNIADVTNGKLRWKKEGGSVKRGRKRRKQRSTEVKVAPAPARSTSREDVTASDLLVIKKAIGPGGFSSFAASVEQVGQLAEQIGGLERLRKAVKALNSLLGTE